MAQVPVRAHSRRAGRHLAKDRQCSALRRGRSARRSSLAQQLAERRGVRNPRRRPRLTVKQLLGLWNQNTSFTLVNPEAAIRKALRAKNGAVESKHLDGRTLAFRRRQSARDDVLNLAEGA